MNTLVQYRYTKNREFGQGEKKEKSNEGAGINRLLDQIMLFFYNFSIKQTIIS